jgi:Flp pilus assembly protein TadG
MIPVRRLLADRSGAAALELAIVTPVLVTFIMGIWYLGWALNLGSEVRHAVELGSRIYITNPSATSSDLQTAVAAHLTDVPVSSISLATSTSTVGLASSEHITWSYQTTAPIPFVSAIPVSFAGAYDVPLATP